MYFELDPIANAFLKRKDLTWTKSQWNYYNFLWSSRSHTVDSLATGIKDLLNLSNLTPSVVGGLSSNAD